MGSFSYLASILISVLYLLISSLYIALFYTDRRIYHSIARPLVFVNIAIHFSSFVYAGITEGGIPLTTTFQVIAFLTLIVTCIYVFIEPKFDAKSLGAFVFPLIFLLNLISIFGSRLIPVELDILKTPLFGFHIISSVIGYSAFVYSMVLGIMYLYLFHSIKKKRLTAAYDRLPPLLTLEKMNGISQIGGLIFLTIGIATGATMAHIEWKKIPLADPKILLTGIIVLIYLLNVVLKFGLKWSGKRMAYMAVVGFCLLIVVFVGVNFILPTLHKFS